MRKFCLIGVLLLALPAVAQADPCKDMFNGMADEMDKMAAAYDTMTTDRQICAYGRSTAIPTRQRIVAKIEASGCPNSGGQLQMMRESLRKSVANTGEACRKAGM
jgi:hypothetical protein